ncbi:MAG: hypothetical protein QF416_10495 [Candidatus Marinimicrobia bacterium]|nr:hypothetical protein [Candidatus Neomarinimicrobiota bacterium]MDP7060886.1 hypothetical protein [Candidatus Neomarinimicrobiota bacterium]
MKIKLIITSMTFVSIGLIAFACSTSSAKTGTATLIVSGNVHSQLDPCG